MASCSCSFLVLVCVSLMAASLTAGNTVRTVVLNGALICQQNGAAAAANIRVSLVCGSDNIGTGVVVEATTTATGTISATVNVGPRTRNAISSAECILAAPPQICPGTTPANAVLGATVTVTRSGNTLTVTPGQIGPLRQVQIST